MVCSVVIQFLLKQGRCNVCSSFGALDNYASLVSRAEQPPFWRVVIQSNQAYSCVFLNGIKLKKYFARSAL